MPCVSEFSGEKVRTLYLSRLFGSDMVRKQVVLYTNMVRIFHTLPPSTPIHLVETDGFVNMLSWALAERRLQHSVCSCHLIIPPE